MLYRGMALNWFRLLSDCSGVKVELMQDVTGLRMNRYSLWLSFGGREYFCQTLPELVAVFSGVGSAVAA